MRRPVVTCCLAIACTPAGGGGGAPDLAPAPPTLTFRADTVHYFQTGQRVVEQEFQGQVTQQESQLRAWISTALAGGTGDLQAQIVLDSVTTTGNVFAAGDLSGMRGATWVGRLAPTGELLDLAGPSDPGLANQMYNTMTEFYPRLPPAGVAAGDAWVDTITSDVDVGGVGLTIVTVNRHQAVGLQAWSAGEAFLIRVVSDYTLNGEGSQSGQPLALAGAGRRHTMEYLSPDGRYLGNVVADTSTYDITLTALGMSSPGRQWRHDTLRVVP